MKNLSKRIMAILGAFALVALSVTAIAAAPGDVTPNNDIPATARYVDGQDHSVPANGALCTNLPITRHATMTGTATWQP